MGICIPVQQGEEQIDRQFAAVIIENDVGLGPCIGAGMSDYQYTYTRRCRSFDLRESSCPVNTCTSERAPAAACKRWLAP